MYRHKSYEEDLAKELQDVEFARGFLLTLMEGEDGLSLLESLKHTIRRMGIKEFAKFSKIPSESISRMLNSSSAPKIDTLDRYLAPFGLKVKLELEKVA